MDKKFLISVVGLFVVSMLLGGAVHGGFLAADYAKLGAMFRPEAQQGSYFGFMILAHVFIGIGVTWAYRGGREKGKPHWEQGLRFGAGLAVLITIPNYMIYYAVQPMPADLVVKQILLDTVSMLLLGVAAAYLNKE